MESNIKFVFLHVSIIYDDSREYKFIQPKHCSKSLQFEVQWPSDFLRRKLLIHNKLLYL